MFNPKKYMAMTTKEEKMLYSLYEQACDYLDGNDNVTEESIICQAKDLSTVLTELGDCEFVDDVTGVLGEFFSE